LEALGTPKLTTSTFKGDLLNPPKLTEVEERLLQEALEKNESKVLRDLLSSIVQNQIDLLQSWPREGAATASTLQERTAMHQQAAQHKCMRR
jgi:hypothetical protein